MVVSPAANSPAFQVSTPSDNEIVMTRLFNAPRELVFEVMSKPEHVKHGMTRMTATCSYPSKDVRDMVRSTGMEKGAACSYDRLEDLIAELQKS